MCENTRAQNHVPVTQLSLAKVPLVPAAGALLGHYYGAGTIAETGARIGKQPQIHLTYYGWAEHWAISDATKQDLADGRIPLVNWNHLISHLRT